MSRLHECVPIEVTDPEYLGIGATFTRCAWCGAEMKPLNRGDTMNQPDNSIPTINDGDEHVAGSATPTVDAIENELPSALSLEQQQRAEAVAIASVHMRRPSVFGGRERAADAGPPRLGNSHQFGRRWCILAAAA